jgi:hypothetical protein
MLTRRILALAASLIMAVGIAGATAGAASASALHYRAPAVAGHVFSNHYR